LLLCHKLAEESPLFLFKIAQSSRFFGSGSGRIQGPFWQGLECAGFDGEAAYVAMLQQSHHSIGECHEDFPAKKSDFQDLRVGVHAAV
jgi:hypothetical protein